MALGADYRSGGMVVLEDYAVSTYWPNEDHSLYLNMARQESLLTNHAAVSPFKRESVISFADGTLVHCDENFGIWHQMEGRPYDQVAWGNASNVFYSTAAHAMCVFDLRELTHESMVCESEARLQGLCAPHCDNNLIVTHNPDYLTIFDLRILPWPALRISRNLIGCDNFSWTGWLDRGMMLRRCRADGCAWRGCRSAGHLLDLSRGRSALRRLRSAHGTSRGGLHSVGAADARIVSGC